MKRTSIAEAVNQHRNRNSELKIRFEEQGLQLDEPCAVEFHFWAWTQRDAAVIGRSLYQMGFLIRLLSPAHSEDDPDRWSIEAGAKIPLIQALGDELTEKLVRLAAAEDGVFDGWGTTV